MYFRKPSLSRKSEMLTQFGRFARNGGRPYGRLSAEWVRVARAHPAFGSAAALLDDAAKMLGTGRASERRASRVARALTATDSSLDLD